MDLIRLHIPKTGGTSISNLLGDYHRGQIGSTGVELYECPKQFMLFVNHLTPAMLVERGIFTADTLFKSQLWTIVRNPWARFASLFYGIGRSTRFTNIFENFVLRTLEDRSLVSSSEPVPIGATQDEWLLLDGERVVDTVVRMEHLNDDFSVIGRRLGVGEPSRHNVHDYPHYMEFYTDRARDAVADAESYVIERFGYRFGEDGK